MIKNSIEKKLKLKVGNHGRKRKEELKQQKSKQKFKYEYLQKEGYEYNENNYQDSHNIEHSLTLDLEEGKFNFINLIRRR